MASTVPPVIVEPPKPEPAAPPQTAGEGSSANGGQPQSPAAPADAPKLSVAELKKQAKAEKAARRAKAVQEKQSGAVTSSPSGPSGQGQKPEGLKVSKGSQHRRTGSSSAGSQSLPIRGNTPRTASAPAPVVPKEEDKTVEFFRHLYKTRTTTVAGASKEIHPAVLALGMQMSNYTVCGSCARLVATLQAFKKVRLGRLVLNLSCL